MLLPKARKRVKTLFFPKSLLLSKARETKKQGFYLQKARAKASMDSQKQGLEGQIPSAVSCSFETSFFCNCVSFQEKLGVNLGKSTVLCEHLRFGPGLSPEVHSLKRANSHDNLPGLGFPQVWRATSQHKAQDKEQTVTLLVVRMEPDIEENSVTIFQGS